MTAITRRALLTMGLPLVSGFRSGALPGSGPVSRVRVAVRGPLPEITLREQAELLAGIGYQGIELGPERLDRTAEQILADLRGTGISVSAIVGSLELLNPDATARASAVELDRQRLRMAAALGADAVIEVPVFGECRFQDFAGTGGRCAREDDLLVDALRQLNPEAEKTAVMILVEPLTREETHYMNHQSHGARIIEAAGSREVRLLSDFYHMQMEEKDIEDTLNRYGKFTGYVHLAEGKQRTEPGSLGFDFRPGFRALKRQGFSGWLTIESAASDDPVSALKRALPVVRKQWDEA